MDVLKELFEYQRFEPNHRLQEQIDAVYRRYFSEAQALSDDALDIAAAGEPWMEKGHMPPGTATIHSEGACPHGSMP